MANLVLLCSRHHHVLHQPGWHAKLWRDGEFRVTGPRGAGALHLTAAHGKWAARGSNPAQKLKRLPLYPMS